MSNFPVPPRMTDGLVNAPTQNRFFDRRRRSDFWDEGVFEQKPPRGFRENIKPLMEDGYVMDSKKMYHPADGFLSEPQNRHDFRGNNEQPNSDRRQPQSLMSNPVAPPLMHNNNFRIPKSQQQDHHNPLNHQRRSSYGSKNNNYNRNDDYNSSNRNRPYREQQYHLSPFEKRAMDAELTSNFFNKVKPLKLMQAANEIALEFSRKEIDEKRGGNTSLVNDSFTPGNHSCTVCKLNFDVRDAATEHFKTKQHLEVEDLFKLKKEQAKLIMQNKITKPNKQSPKPPATNPVNPDILTIAKAEAEMELKPTEMDLDPYILGIYESIMKPYWPSPSSDYYCRICNYIEFSNEEEFNQHVTSKEHVDHEKAYDDAFCLYCQIHNGSQAGMVAHSKSNTHEKIKDLMEKSKQTAIEHWHRVNNLELPEKYKPECTQPIEKDNSGNAQEPAKKTNQEVGSKRSAPDPPDSSPTKKPTMVAKDLKPSVTESNNKKEDKGLLPREKAWFIPVTTFMCAACQIFVEEKNQKAHVKEITHNTNVIKFKRQINS